MRFLIGLVVIIMRDGWVSNDPSLITLSFQIAVEKSCVRVDWSCLNWNKTAKDFYSKLGAVYLDKLERYRLTGKRLLEFAGKNPK